MKQFGMTVLAVVLGVLVASFVADKLKLKKA